MIFDIKMEDFSCKARLVAGGKMTEPPATITYASIVSRETVRIALTLDVLNELPVKVADTQNDYITAPATEKIWTLLGQDFGEDTGGKGIVVWDLYGLKSAGADFRNHLAECMHYLRFLPCTDDLDLWMKPMARPEDGFNYYFYVLIYVENVMAIHHDADSVLRQINKYFNLKPRSQVAYSSTYIPNKFQDCQSNWASN